MAQNRLGTLASQESLQAARTDPPAAAPPGGVVPDEIPQEFQIDVPDDMETGVPADFASVWHTPTSFVLDFIAVKQPPSPTTDPDTGEVTNVVVPGRVVSRVRIPPQQVFELAKALTMQLDAWENESGKPRER
jgi:hypothetical protein